MESPGEFLKRERELRGVTIETISLELRLSPKTIEAIEDNNQAELPHSAYVKGFIRSYCHWLGLDDNDAVLRYEAYLRERAEIDLKGGKTNRSKATSDSTASGIHPRTKTGLQSTVIFAVAGLLIIIGYIVVYGPSRPDMVTVPKAEIVIDDAVRDEATDDEVVLVDEAKPSEVIPSTIVLPEGSDLEVPLATKEDISSGLDADLIEMESLAVAETTPLAEEVLAAKKELSLELSASELSWVEVSTDGDPPYDITLRAGERVSLKAAKVFF